MEKRENVKLPFPTAKDIIDTFAEYIYNSEEIVGKKYITTLLDIKILIGEAYNNLCKVLGMIEELLPNDEPKED